MLKNFTITLVVAGTLWSTPLSFIFMGNPGVEVQIASAIPTAGTSIPATRLPTQEADDPASAFDLECLSWTDGINLGDCAAIIGYGLFYVPTSLVLMAGGTIFDAFIALSLDNFLLNQPFVKTTWGTVRDLANLVFILVLLWIAISTILNLGGVQLKQAVVNVVIIALLINFSYFFTRVVIDASNVVAFEFYSAIGAGQVSMGNHINGVTEYRISEKIVGAVSPQKLLSPETFTAWSEKNDASKGYLFFLFLLGGVINLVLAYVLFYAGFLLLGRVIAFVFLIIAAPLAFISYALPRGGSFTGSWWNQLLNQALVAPVFLFFLYVIVQLAGAGLTMFNTGVGGSITSNFTDILTTILLKASIVVVALMIALSKTKSLSGSAGQWATKAGTVAFGTALAGTALVGRHTFGQGAKMLRDSDAGKRLIAKTGVAGEYLDRGLGAVAGGTMDIRGIPGMDKAGLGRPANKGGYEKFASEQVKRKEGLAKRLGDTRMPKYEQGPSGERSIRRDAGGNIVYQQKEITDKKTGEKNWVDKTAKDVYTERLEKRGDRLWGASNREAAKKIKKGKTPEQELLDKIKEAAKEEAKKETGGSEKAETVVKETEKPKET